MATPPRGEAAASLTDYEHGVMYVDLADEEGGSVTKMNDFQLERQGLCDPGQDAIGSISGVGNQRPVHELLESQAVVHLNAAPIMVKQFQNDTG